ncbi:esterase/lipase family protein [Pseudorhodoferax sp.]|uniref:esterase/lipase family protein n=1 Tax=Pseudorhodoferax sp. TaxID=1993553 RepID=UPI0039E5B09D
MSAVPPEIRRSQVARPDKSGRAMFEWTLTGSNITDTVRLIGGPFNVLPVVFVPGIMGSNLRAKGAIKPTPIWRLDTTGGEPAGLLNDFLTKGPGLRQTLLHPDRCEVDDQGAIPSTPVGTVHVVETFRDRGWGTVGEGSYHKFLLWLEEALNPGERNPALWPDYHQTQASIGPSPASNSQPKLSLGLRMGMKGEPFGSEKQPFSPVFSNDLIARGKFLFPVYAVGYNWLASNSAAAAELATRITGIIDKNNIGAFRCKQVILVTHSMGGLVARACAQISDMSDKIAGIVHGAMPATGAAVAYRRCKLGMRDESYLASLVIGGNGQEVTAVFSQAPEALQLLPSQLYKPEWLRISQTASKPALQLPSSGPNDSCDPYSEIYSNRDHWWGLVNESWLAPSGGTKIKWSDYIDNLNTARDFHSKLGRKYHHQTYAYYGADPKQPSFETMTWRIRQGLRPEGSDKSLPAAKLQELSPQEVRMDGINPEYVGGKTVIQPTYSPMGSSVSIYETSQWELHGEMQDGAGDGTVPISSGSAPLRHGPSEVKQQFKLIGFSHEKSYNDAMARRATLYSINKIAGAAKNLA